MPTLKLQTTHELIVPTGVVVIRNDDFVTLARKVKKGIVAIITTLNDEIVNIDLNEEDNWTYLSKEELKKIIALLG